MHSYPFFVSDLLGHGPRVVLDLLWQREVVLHLKLHVLRMVALKIVNAFQLDVALEPVDLVPFLAAEGAADSSDEILIVQLVEEVRNGLQGLQRRAFRTNDCFTSKTLLV